MNSHTSSQLSEGMEKCGKMLTEKEIPEKIITYPHPRHSKMTVVGLNPQAYSLALRLLFSRSITKAQNQLRAKDVKSRWCLDILGLMTEVYRRQTGKGRWVPGRSPVVGWSFQEAPGGGKYNISVPTIILQHFGLDEDITDRLVLLNDYTDATLPRLLDLADVAQKLRNKDRKDER